MKVKSKVIVLLAITVLFAGCALPVQQVKLSPEEDALFRAARGGHADTVKEVLKPGRVNINVKDETGRTPLMEAARNGHNDVVRTLLNAGADAKLKDLQGKTALMYASEGGHKESVTLLRQAGATE